MNRYIILTGLPASGKSTLGRAVAAALGLPMLDKDDILEALGLEERSSGWGTALGTVGIFALGCLVGAGIGLAFAPKSGEEFRNELGERMRRKADEMGVGEELNRSQMPVT